MSAISHHLSIPHLRAAFGAQSPLVRAAELGDQHGVQDARNDGMYSRSESLARDAFLPPDLKGAYSDLSKLMPADEDPRVQQKNLDSVFASLGRGTQSTVRRDPRPLSDFAGTPLEQAAQTLAQQQADTTVLYSATVEIAAKSKIFGSAHPGAIDKLRRFFAPRTETSPPPPVDDRLVRNEPGFVVTARVEQIDGKRKEQLIVHTQPNAIVTVSGNWLSTRTKKVETWRADSNGHLRLWRDVNRDQTVSVLDPTTLARIGTITF